MSLLGNGSATRWGVLGQMECRQNPKEASGLPFLLSAGYPWSRALCRISAPLTGNGLENNFVRKICSQILRLQDISPVPQLNFYPSR